MWISQKYESQNFKKLPNFSESGLIWDAYFGEPSTEEDALCQIMRAENSVKSSKQTVGPHPVEHLEEKRNLGKASNEIDQSIQLVALAFVSWFLLPILTHVLMNHLESVGYRGENLVFIHYGKEG